MDMRVPGVSLEGETSSLNKGHLRAVQTVRQHARYVVELNARGYVRKIKCNKNPALNIIAVTMPHAGPNTRHGLVLEIGLGRHRPYTRTRECLGRLQYRTLDSQELGRILSVLESLIDYRRAATVARWKVDGLKWVKQNGSNWIKFERGIFISVSVQDQALYYAFCGADLEFRRAAYTLDYYAFLVRRWLKAYKKQAYTQREMRRMVNLRKACDFVRKACGPFVERFYAGKHASLLSCALGRELRGDIPLYLPLTKISARYVSRKRSLKRQTRKTKKGESGIQTFEVLSWEAKENLRNSKKNFPRLHEVPMEGCTPEWEAWLQGELFCRYQRVSTRHQVPTG